VGAHEPPLRPAIGISSDAAKSVATGGVQDASARDMELAIITIAYGHRELSPDEIAAQTLQGCMQGVSR
jgi:hypothetical protein